MAKNWLIDAHNLIHQVPELKRQLGYNHPEAFAGLCMMVEQACVSQQKRASVIFDGSPVQIPGNFSRLDLRFSRERTADEVIISLLSEDDARNKWIVVSDDREIRQNAYYYHVEIARSRDFFESSSPRKKPVKKTGKQGLKDPGKTADLDVPDEEVQEMLRLFNQQKKNK